MHISTGQGEPALGMRLRIQTQSKHLSGLLPLNSWFLVLLPPNKPCRSSSKVQGLLLVLAQWWQVNGFLLPAFSTVLAATSSLFSLCSLRLLFHKQRNISQVNPLLLQVLGSLDEEMGCFQWGKSRRLHFGLCFLTSPRLPSMNVHPSSLSSKR